MEENEDNKTKNQKRKVACKECDNRTSHVVCSSLSVSWGNEDIQGRHNYEIIKCLGCESISFRIGSTNSDDYEQDDEGKYYSVETEEIYPNRIMGRRLLPDYHLLPHRVRSIYRETHSAFATKLHTLAGVGIRTLVEAVCMEENASGYTLENKIDDLVKKGILTARNAKALHNTRLLGNRAAHEIQSPNTIELGVGLDIIDNLLENVYIIPKKAEGLDPAKRVIKKFG